MSDSGAPKTFYPPILMYHRIADDGPPGLARFRVTPRDFERQLAWLQDNGFHGLRMDEYRECAFGQPRGDMRAKPIVLTFDDAYADFYDTAWPLLRRHGFPATVFVPTGFVGGRAEWDADHGTPAPLMDWPQIVALQAEGVEFGSHGHRHFAMTGWSRLAAFPDALASKRILQSKLRKPVSGFCYPYTVSGRVVRSLVALSGYRYAVAGTHEDDPLRPGLYNISRTEISGDDGLEGFVAKVSRGTRRDSLIRSSGRVGTQAGSV